MISPVLVGQWSSSDQRADQNGKRHYLLVFFEPFFFFFLASTSYLKQPFEGEPFTPPVWVVAIATGTPFFVVAFSVFSSAGTV